MILINQPLGSELFGPLIASTSGNIRVRSMRIVISASSFVVLGSLDLERRRLRTPRLNVEILRV